MTRTIRAVYEKGVFRPVEPVALNEGKDVEVVIQEEDATEEMSTEEHARMIERLLAIADKPDAADDDGLGGDKHDEIIYGSQDDAK